MPDSRHTDTAIKWQPDPEYMRTTALYRLMEKYGHADYHACWRWSIAGKETFWSEVWDIGEIIGEKTGPVFTPAATFQASRFFPQAKLNYAENLLRRRDGAPALVSLNEQQRESTMTFAQLYNDVSRMRQYLKNLGVAKGDRVAGYMPNIPETIVAMLAATSLGAIWASASPDFGVDGVLDRFGQIAPKVLFAVDGYFYNGKTIDCRDKISEIVARMPSLEKTVVVPHAYKNMSHAEKIISYTDAMATHSPAEIVFDRFGFDHPLFIMFSSGTTGAPKCIVHGAGGTLLQHAKEHRLHCDIRPDDKVFYFTTCGWMMWNWLVSALSCGATLLLYDGAPLYPETDTLPAFAKRHGCTFFGASAKYIDALRTHGLHAPDPNSTVRVMASTGSPLSPEGFDFIYDSVFPRAQLASISGGTDIVSCFVLGNPVSPVYRGEIQGAALGMDVDVFDENGAPRPHGKGELVCKTPFPCMPVAFWNDPDGARYHAAYFERFPNIWHHGDWCEGTAHNGFVIHGRSDATLNPGGVRIGTAEIYRIVEQLPEITESIAVGQTWEDDVRVVLFVVLAQGAQLDTALVDRIKSDLRKNASPRHVPAKIIAVADIPRTKSGKISEIAVRDTIHNRPVRNTEALANPETLAYYQNLPALQT